MSFGQSAPSAGPNEKKYLDPEKGPVAEIHPAIADERYRKYPAGVGFWPLSYVCQ